MLTEPPIKRAMAFVDGQNLFYAGRNAFGYTFPNYRNSYDVALIFSQDQDLSEVADEIRQVSRQQSRWIKTACAFPSSPVSSNRRGINGTDWIKIDRATYDACLDPRDYRPKPKT